jgi:hypothetical protein
LGDARLPEAGSSKVLPCIATACLPRRAAQRTDPSAPESPTAFAYETAARVDDDSMPAQGLTEVERWRVWRHDHTNALKMTGLRLVQLCVEHRLGQPRAASLVLTVLEAVGALFKFPAQSVHGGYLLRWDPAADDDWETEIVHPRDRFKDPIRVTPVLPCRFLLNGDLKGWTHQRYLYCTPVDDPRYRREVERLAGEGRLPDGKDRFRRWEPSKDEYVGLLCGLNEVFSTFDGSADAMHLRIVGLVREHCGRIARYLQATGYLLTRPCGNVTIRGCGEILPLLEFAFGPVFRRVLGDPFESRKRYLDALAEANVRVPLSALSITGSTLSTLRSGLVAGLRALAPAGWLRERLGDFVNALDEQRQVELLALWQHRNLIDALNPEMEAEVLIGFVFNALPRPARAKALYQWLATPGKSIADAFKPYLALMGLDHDAAMRRAYLDWFDPIYAYSPTQQLGRGEYDWTFAWAVALLVAQADGQLDRAAEIGRQLGRQLETMRRQLHAADPIAAAGRAALFAVVGAGTSPLDHLEAPDCGVDAPLALASEYHDKVGNWFGYLAPLALAWRHLLSSAAPPFDAPSAIALPKRESVVQWPEPQVPAEVIAEARARPDRMPVPLAAITRDAAMLDGTRAVPLFANPPPRLRDAEIGAAPPPVGTIVTFDLRGGLFARTERRRFEYRRPDSIAAEPEAWSEAPALREIERTRVERSGLRVQMGVLELDAVLQAPILEWVSGPFGIPVPRLRFARYAGELSLAWARQR